MSKSYYLISIIIIGFIISTFARSSTLNGRKLFIKEGCANCHSKNKGGNDPFPSKQKLANNDYYSFENCVLKGRAGTPMTPKKLKKKDIKAIYKWLQKFK